MRSECPLSYGLELFGDRWSLLIIRDIMFDGKRYYGEFLQSPEGISTNILADRLSLLEREGIISKRPDEHHKQKLVYSLTQKGRDLMPIITAIIVWSVRHNKDIMEGFEQMLSHLKVSKQLATQKILERLEKASIENSTTSINQEENE